MRRTVDRREKKEMFQDEKEIEKMISFTIKKKGKKKKVNHLDLLTENCNYVPHMQKQQYEKKKILKWKKLT